MNDNIHRGSDFNEFLNNEITKELAPNKQNEVLAEMSTTNSIQEICATIDMQRKEKDDAIAKIWKHYREMWT
jgi:hypothetical protein